MTLRPYQETAVVSALDALAKCGSAVLQMPTGAGKTRAATEIIKRLDKPVWFVCHRQEIERQAAAAFKAAGIDFGILSPRADEDLTRPVQIISVGTLAKRISELPLPSAVIWDECHHVAAKSWAKIREALSEVKHLGLTATPERLDGKGLGEWFAELIVGPSTRDLIDDGYLSEFRYFAPSEPDLTGAKLRAGDYRKEDVAKAMNMPVLIGDAVSEYKAKAGGKRAIVFCASVEASQALVDRFNAEGVLAAHIDGTTPTTVRDAAIEDLAAGRIKVLSNVEVFTEGFDLPAIDAVFLLRPTKSVALFLQMIGRALRKADGKDEAIIFDHSGLWLEHGWFDASWDWSLEGGARKRRLASSGEGRLRRCPSCKEVRQERAEACDCGYEFPTGREIGEFDGQLWELRSVVPEGFETLKSFAGRYGVSDVTARNWSKRGMPIDGFLIQSAEADAWVKDNINLEYVRRKQVERSLPEGLESQSQFSKRIGVSDGTINRFAKIGLPMRDGYVDVTPALEWIGKMDIADIKRRSTQAKDRPIGYMNAKEFAARHGYSVGATIQWKRTGLPHDDNGIPVDEGDRWIIERRTNNPRASAKWGKDLGLMRPTDVARECGLNPSSITYYVRNGCPTHKSGLIDICEFKKWAAITPGVSTNKPPFWEVDPMAYCSRKTFSRVINVSQDYVTSLGKRGLPCASNGWVHIQLGLEWVRDNTNIAIPPEAWPAANDNAEAEKVTREMHAEARALLDGKPKKFGEAA